MPKAASTSAYNANVRTTADVHSASTHMHRAAADMHSAPTAPSATMTAAAMTAAAMTAAAAGQKRGRWQNQAGGNSADKKRGTQHDDPPLEA
jgi:hypothetical protein